MPAARGLRGGVLGALVLVAACHVLPSGVPLSDTGGVLEDTGTDRDRVAQHTALTLVLNEPKPAAPSNKSAPAATSEAPDAGAPTSATAASDAGIVGSAWAGEYFGSDKLTRHFEGEADDVELDDKAHTRVEEPTPGALVIPIVNSATGELICALHATARGSQASLDAGQTCFGDDGSTSTVINGRAGVASERLTLDFEAKVVENDPDDDDSDPAEFRLDYHFDGRRR